MRDQDEVEVYGKRPPVGSMSIIGEDRSHRASGWV